MNANTITEALRYYDECNDRFNKLRKNIKYVDIADIDNAKQIICFDAENHAMFRSKFEFIGKYYNKEKVWSWGWSIPDLDKKLTNTIRNIFLYGTDIENARSNIGNAILKTALITSRFRIDDPTQLDIYCALALYLGKKPFIMAVKDFNVKHEETRSDRLINAIDPRDIYDDTNTDVTYCIFMDTPPKLNISQ
jgi:hypothetical protein